MSNQFAMQQKMEKNEQLIQKSFPLSVFFFNFSTHAPQAQLEQLTNSFGALLFQSLPAGCTVQKILDWN